MLPIPPTCLPHGVAAACFFLATADRNLRLPLCWRAPSCRQKNRHEAGLGLNPTYIYRSTYRSIYRSIYLYVWLSIIFFYPSIYRANYLSIYLSICLSIDQILYIYIYISLSICPSVYLSIYLSMSLPIYFSTCLGI